MSIGNVNVLFGEVSVQMLCPFLIGSFVFMVLSYMPSSPEALSWSYGGKESGRNLGSCREACLLLRKGPRLRRRLAQGAVYLPPTGRNSPLLPDSCLKYYSSSPHDPLGILPPSPQPHSPSLGNCALEGCYEYSATSDYKSSGKQIVLWKC